MIERREIVGVAYERVETAEGFAAWLTANGWPEAAAFQREVGLDFEALKGRWFFVTKHGDQHYCYARTVSGVKVLR